MKDTRLTIIAKIIIGTAIGFTVTTAAIKSAHAQPIGAPAGTPVGANWTTNGRTAGGYVRSPGELFPTYSYPNPATQPYTLNPGAAWQMGGVAAGAAGAMIGQPAAGGVVAGALGAIGASVDKSRGGSSPTVSWGSATGGSGGGLGSGGWTTICLNCDGPAKGTPKTVNSK